MHWPVKPCPKTLSKNAPKSSLPSEQNGYSFLLDSDTSPSICFLRTVFRGILTYFVLDLCCLSKYLRNENEKRLTDYQLDEQMGDKKIYFDFAFRLVTESKAEIMVIFGRTFRKRLRWRYRQELGKQKLVAGERYEAVIGGVDGIITCLNHLEYLVRWVDPVHAAANVKSLQYLIDLGVEIDMGQLQRLIEKAVEDAAQDGGELLGKEDDKHVSSAEVKVL
jgi:hypothetical protein